MNDMTTATPDIPAISTAMRTKQGVMPICAVTLLILAFVAWNVRWVWLFRLGRTLDIDEAGYLNLALVDYYGFLYQGLHGWIAAIESPSLQAPLTMALTSLVFKIAGPHAILGFAVPLAAGAGCIAATYVLGATMGSRRAGVAAALFVATCPVIVNFSRSYNFATLATLIATCALVAILHSRHFRSRQCMIWFGMLLGLLPLARTMTIAFVPGLAAAAFVTLIVDPVSRGRRLIALALSFLLAILVAATWFWQSGPLVAQYLLSFGYGAHAVEDETKFVRHASPVLAVLTRQFAKDVYLPHYFVLWVGLVALLIALARLTIESGFRSAMARCLRSSVLPVLIFAAEALAILNTTANEGNAFIAPVVPALAVLTTIAFEKACRSERCFFWSYSLIAIVAIGAALPMTDLRSPLARESVGIIPLLGKGTVMDGRGTMQRYEAIHGYKSDDFRQPVSADTERAWVDLNIRTSNMLAAEVGSGTVIAFGFRNIFFNVNTINLMQLLHVDSAFAVRQIDPIATGDSVAGYAAWLQKQNPDACVLLTSDRISGDFEPAVNREFMQQAAVESGFIHVKQWPAPDGQVISMWQPAILPANCRRAAQT